MSGCEYAQMGHPAYSNARGVRAFPPISLVQPAADRRTARLPARSSSHALSSQLILLLRLVAGTHVRDQGQSSNCGRSAATPGHLKDLRQGESESVARGRHGRRRGGSVKISSRGPLADRVERCLAHKHSLGKQLTKVGAMLRLLDGYLLYDICRDLHTDISKNNSLAKPLRRKRRQRLSAYCSLRLGGLAREPSSSLLTMRVMPSLIRATLKLMSSPRRLSASRR